MVNEERITPRQAAEVCRSLGATTVPFTVRRWMTDGVRGVKLEGYWVAGRMFTTREALTRFLAKLNGTAVGA